MNHDQAINEFYDKIPGVDPTITPTEKLTLMLNSYDFYRREYDRRQEDIGEVRKKAYEEALARHTATMDFNQAIKVLGNMTINQIADKII